MNNVTRWLAMAASAACMAVGMSAVFMGSFPIFLEPVSGELGWGRAVLPQLITVISVGSAVLMPFTGRLIDRIGVRFPVAIGLALVALGMTLLSQMHREGHIFWIAALCLGTGSALSGPLAYVALVSSWFDKNRALALGCVLSIAPMLSQALVVPITLQLLHMVGWRAAYQFLGATIAVVGISASLCFLKSNPAALNARPGHIPASNRGARDAVKTVAFWKLTIASFLASGSLIGFSVHLVSWLTDRAIPAGSAALTLSTLFLSGIAGSFLSGVVADRSTTIRPIQLFFALPLAGLAIMAFSTSLVFLVLGAILVGLGMSAATGLTPFLVTRYFGLQASGEIFGIVLAITMVGIGSGPVLIGLGFDYTGSYNLSIIAIALAVAIAAVSIGLLPRTWFVPANSDADEQQGVPVARPAG